MSHGRPTLPIFKNFPRSPPPGIAGLLNAGSPITNAYGLQTIAIAGCEGSTWKMIADA